MSDKIEGDNMSDRFIEVACPFCNSEEYMPYRSISEIVKCLNCETVYLRKRFRGETHKELFQKFIPDEELIDSEEDLLLKNNSRADFLNDILELTNERGEFVDIGCGWGSLLKSADDLDFKVKGYEINYTKAGFTAEKLGFEVEDDFFDDQSIEDESVSIITATYSLSNIDKMKSFFDKVYKKLKHEGLFCGIVNNIDSFASEALEDEWECLNPYENTIYFSPQSLTNFLESSGFVIERLYTTTGNYDIEMLKHIVKDAFDLENEEEILEQIDTINADGMGEEIRFFARKPKIDIFEKPDPMLEIMDEAFDNIESQYEEVADEFIEEENISDLEEISEIDIDDKLSSENVEEEYDIDAMVLNDVIEISDNVFENDNLLLLVNDNEVSENVVSGNNIDILTISINEGDDYDSIIYNAIKNMDRPMKIIVNDKDNYLPDYANNWNGIELSHEEESISEIENIAIPHVDLIDEMTAPEIEDNEVFEEVVPMNRLRFEEDLTGGFANQNASGTLPEVLPSPLSLNLGCGNDIRENFINIDLYSNSPDVVKMDIRKLELPNDCADLILASDVLEHFSHREVDDVLKEWARVLKPDGSIIIRCPSLKLQMKAYMNGTWDADVASYMIFGGQTNPGDYHCIGFDEQSIKKHLANAGLLMTDIIENDTPQDKGFINLNMTLRAKRINTNKIANDSDILKDKIDEISIESNSVNNEFIGFDFGEDTENDNLDVSENDNDKYNEIIEEVDEVTETEVIAEDMENVEELKPELNIVWEGAQFAYHSLALINREHCTNIMKSRVAELTTVPYGLDEFSPEGNEKFEAIYTNDIRIKAPTSEEIGSLPYAWIRHQWPTKEEEPMGAKWIIMQPWEYSYLWKEMAEVFKSADEIWTPSTYSRNAIVNSGIDFNKVQVIPNGIDPTLFKPYGEIYNLNTEKRFKFLFVGGTIYRKGIDILLNAYSSVFKASDNVCLVIKDMGTDSFYQGMNAKENIAKFQEKADSPEIIYIDDTLTEEQMAELYRACDVLVCPYRGEGFSLPTLEAMACGLPVVVTNGGATDDFCNEEVAWMIDSKEFELGTELDGKELCGNATMLEPDIESLTATLRTIFDNPSEVFATGLKASRRARAEWTWNRATLKLLSRLDVLYDKNMAKKAQSQLPEFKDSSILLATADNEYLEKNYDVALNLYNSIAGDYALSDEWRKHCLLRIASIYIVKNDFVQANNYINDAEIIVPDTVDAKYLRAKVNMLENKWIEALEGVTEVLDNWADWKYNTSLGLALDELLCDTAEGLMNIDDVDNSLKLYSQALKYNNASSRACLGSAKCFIWAGGEDQAKEMLEWAIKLDADNDEAKELLDGIVSKI